MPVRKGKDSKGPFYRWGRTGKKYHYKPNSKASRESAKGKARKQGRAVRARRGR